MVTALQAWVWEGFGQCSQEHDVISGMSCAGPGAGLNDPDGAFPTHHILWFYFVFFSKNERKKKKDILSS